MFRRWPTASSGDEKLPSNISDESAEMTADAAAAALPAMTEGVVEEGRQRRQQQRHQQRSTSESGTDQVDAPSSASFDRAEVPKPAAAPARDEEDVTTCATMADAFATVAAGTDDRAAEEEEEHGRVVDVGNGSNDRPPPPAPLVEPPPVIPSSEEATISTMMLDDSDRDLIAARLAVLEASAEDIHYIISSPNDDDDDDVNAGAEADESEEDESSDDHSSSTDDSDSSSSSNDSEGSNSEDVENENIISSSPPKKSRGSSIMVEDVTSYYEDEEEDYYDEAVDVARMDDEDEDDDSYDYNNDDDDDDDDLEAGILTKEQVLRNGSSIGNEGNIFYSAYNYVRSSQQQPQRRLPPVYYDDSGPEPLLYIDDDNTTAIASNSKRRSGKRMKRIGHDRASVKGMMVQRVAQLAPHQVANSARRHATDISMMAADPKAIWTNPRKRRSCIGLTIAAGCFIIGMVFIIGYGVNSNIERQSNNIITNEGGDDVGGGDIEFNYPQHGSPIHHQTSPDTDGNAGGVGIQPSSNLQVLPTMAPTIPVPPDDALMTLLKKAYYDALWGVGGSGNAADMASDIVHTAQNVWLDSRSNFAKPRDEQTPQYRAYTYMYTENILLVTQDTDRILQIYSLLVFYENFNWMKYQEAVGGIDKECNWPGVTCHDLYSVDRVMQQKGDDIDEAADNLRVVALNFGSRDVETSSVSLLEGTLPVELMFLKDLETLDVSYNLLMGELWGAMVAEWKNIKVLDLNDNRFQGTIPIELGDMKSLQKLTLHHNNFIGEVPEALCDLRDEALHFLWVDCAPMPTTNLPKVFCPIASCCSICFEGSNDVDNAPNFHDTPNDANAFASHVVGGDEELAIKSILMGSSSDKGQALVNIHTPQFRAYAWLVTDSSYAQGYTTQRLLQRYALATLYHSTNGPLWRNSDKWMSLSDECDWYGVSGCQKNSTITTINSNSVSSIDLKANRLSGPAPPELFEFLNLKILNLANNDLTGPIPKEIAWHPFEVIDLAENQFTSIPSEMSTMKTLNHLFLQGNAFGSQTLPDGVCELRDSGVLTLLWADCKQCSISCCTTCFSGWSSDEDEDSVAVTHADLDGNLLNALKRMSHDNGASLDDLLSPQYKAYNWLVTSVNTTVSGTKLDISHTEFLQRYGLATLFFSTSGHGWLFNSGWLSSSDVCDWSLIECNGKSMVTVLLLNSNNLRGTIPTELAYVTMLERLDLGDNELYGPIPTEFGQLVDMEKLSLSGNMLTGTIPSQLSNMVNLQLLFLHGNDFSGISIPKEICTLRTNYILKTLWADCIADDDNIKKVVCECCTQCFSDESEYAPHADIGHEVPSHPATTPTVNVEQTGPPTIADRGIGASALIIKEDNQKLRTFLLGHMNGFQERLDDTTSYAHEAYQWLANDKITDSLDDFRKLQRFGLVTFFLSTSPDTPWKVSNGWSTSEHECIWYGIYCAVNDTVTTISLPGNNLAGTIPPEIALAAIGGKVKRLNLAGNSISKAIPIQLGTMTHLELLDLRSNDFTGQIPFQLGKLKLLKTLNFGMNELMGTMPDEVCSLRTTASLETLIADCDTCNKSCCTECY